jgi:hypothetical protein
MFHARRSGWATVIASRLVLTDVRGVLDGVLLFGSMLFVAAIVLFSRGI